MSITSALTIYNPISGNSSTLSNRKEFSKKKRAILNLQAVYRGNKCRSEKLTAEQKQALLEAKERRMEVEAEKARLRRHVGQRDRLGFVRYQCKGTRPLFDDSESCSPGATVIVQPNHQTRARRPGQHLVLGHGEVAQFLS